MNTFDPRPKIVELRALLAQKFPAPPVRQGALLPTGLPRLDEALGGGLCKGGMVELVAERPSCGASAVLREVLLQAGAAERWVGLIDGSDAFDLEGMEPALARLLWLRCRHVEEAVQCADLLLRDGNLPLVCLDLRGNLPAELRQVTGPSWYRLQRMLEPTATALLAVTPFALIPCAEVRLLVEGRFSLASLEDDPATLWDHLTLKTLRRRQAAPAEEPLEATA